MGSIEEGQAVNAGPSSISDTISAATQYPLTNNVMPGEKLKQSPENGFAGIHGTLPKCWEVSSMEIQIENEIIVSKNVKIQLLAVISSNFTGQY